MSRILERALRRQRALQDSRNFAWVVFIIVSTIALVSVSAIFLGVMAGTIVSAGGVVSTIFAACSAWIAMHLFREALRLGRLLKDTDYIMRADRDPSLVEGIHWASLLPFSWWRD